MENPRIPALAAVDANDALAFTPVPSSSTRHDGWTPRRQRDFLATLARAGVVAEAAKAVGMSPKSAYALRKRAGAESFAGAWDIALEEGYSSALDTAVERSLDGVVTPVFYGGRQVGERRVFDDRLLLAALRPRRPVGERGAAADVDRLGSLATSSRDNA